MMGKNLAQTVRVSFAALMLNACAVEVGEDTISSDPPSSTSATQQPVVGANPEVDAEFIKEIAPPPGLTRTGADIAVSENEIFVKWSDGTVERRTINGDLGSTLLRKYDRIKYLHHVDNYFLGLLGTKDSEREIYASLQGNHEPPLGIGSYPAGVNSIKGIAGYKNEIYIMYIPGFGPEPVLRKGTYSSSTGILTWQPTTVPYGLYTLPPTVGPSGVSLYRFMSHTITRIQRAPRAHLTPWDSEDLDGHTEHAYLHPEGALDRLAGPLDYRTSDNKFYVLDTYSNLGRTASVLARIPRTTIDF